jgi:hypothetical protein
MLSNLLLSKSLDINKVFCHPERSMKQVVVSCPFFVGAERKLLLRR